MYNEGDTVLVKFRGRATHGVIRRVRPIQFQPFPGEVTFSVDFAHLKYENAITKIIRADEIIGMA